MLSITILILVVSFSYAYIKLEKQEKEVNVVGTDCISLEMIEESNAISIQNTFPVSDEIGMTTNPYRFKLRNECGVGLDYEIHLRVEEGNTMNAKNIATMVDSKKKIVLKDDKKVEKEGQEQEEYRISEEKLTLEPYEEKEHEVRIWLDKDADNDSQNKKFLSKVIIEAVQNQSVCTYESKWDFDYTNAEQTFTVPCDGVYLLEVWGAQGGVDNQYLDDAEGFGGYSKGEITLTASDTLYINVGGQGESHKTLYSDEESLGGYNGGGKGINNGQSGSGGGGATHIAKVHGLLAELEEHKSNTDILIVAGGGGGNGGSPTYFSPGGSGGGYQGANGKNNNLSTYLGTGGSQENGGVAVLKKDDETSQGKFGLGGNYYNDNGTSCSTYNGCGGSGGGGGYYGGGGSSRRHAGAGGGSGYIGNTLLTNKGMWCYQCDASEEVNTKTTSTEQTSEEPISMYAKQGNGFARITYLRIK